MQLKRYVLQAKVPQYRAKGSPLVWRIVDSFDDKKDAESIIPPNSPAEFRILDRFNLSDSFGLRYRRVCNGKKITLAEGARACGYKSHMGWYFANSMGAPRAHTLEKLSAGLGVPVEYLRGEEREK